MRLCPGLLAETLRTDLAAESWRQLIASQPFRWPVVKLNRLIQFSVGHFDLGEPLLTSEFVLAS